MFNNCAVLVGRDGHIQGTYYKTHLRDHDKRFASGMDLPTFHLDCGVIGIVICADRVWPETIRVLRVKGADIALVPAYGGWGLDNEWRMRVQCGIARIIMPDVEWCGGISEGKKIATMAIFGVVS